MLERHAAIALTWGGGCVEETAQGAGTLFIQHSPSTWDRYDGAMREGRMHGPGTLVWATGARYEGGFVDGQFTGEAVLSWGKGARYVGRFKDGLPDGHGALQLDDGRRYEGTWQRGGYWDANRQAWLSWGADRRGWVDSCP